MCAARSDKIRNVPAIDIQCDEIWTFVGNGRNFHFIGDAWTFIGIERNTRIGYGSDRRFMRKIGKAASSDQRFQFSTDGFSPDEYAVGVELEGTDSVPYTAAQYQRLAELTALLQEFYPIRDIVGHSDIAPARKTDPGPAFDWAHFRSLLSITQ